MLKCLWAIVLLFLLVGCSNQTQLILPRDRADTQTRSSPAGKSADPDAHRAATHVPVLLYHHLAPVADGTNGAIISVAAFDEQMGWLRDHGYVAITTQELVGWLKGEKQLPRKSVLITFDDGYQSNYEYAYPILVRHGLKATIFVVTSWIGERLGDFDYLSGAQMRAMQGSGAIEFQLHSHDGHRKIMGRPAVHRWSDYETAADIRIARQRFAQNGIAPFHTFAYPFGAYTARTIDTIEQEGITVGFTVHKGYVKIGDAPYELSRLIVYPGTGLCQFSSLVSGVFQDC